MQSFYSNLRVASLCCLLAAVPRPTLAQSPTPSTVPAAAAPTASPGIPAASASPTKAPMTDVNHVRQLVRDVESNTDNIKAQGDFGAQLWIVQGQEFFQEWIKPASPSINPVSIAPRGENIYTAIIFYGIAHDKGGLANVSYDVTVHKPDGSIYSESKNLIGWQGLAPQETRSLELGRDHVAINLQENDPAGLYTVDVVVRDNISRVELPLKQTFVVQ